MPLNLGPMPNSAGLQPGFTGGIYNQNKGQGDYEPTALSLSMSDFDNNTWFKKLEAMARNGDVAAQEKLLNFIMSEASSKTARDWTAQREDNAYQRLMVDLKKAGISPYVLTGATPAVSSSSGRNYTSTNMTTQANSERSSLMQLLKIIFPLSALLGAMAFA